jgi:hypothetical protein
MMAQVGTAVPPVTQARPDLPEGLVALLDGMLAKDPAQRFATPAQVAEAVEPFCAGAGAVDLLATAGRMPISAPTVPAEGRRIGCDDGRSRFSRRRSLLLAALGLLLLAAAVVAWKPALVLKPAPVLEPATVLEPASAPKASPVVLQQSILIVRRGGDDERIEKLTLTNRPGEGELAFDPLGPKDDFKLHAQFSRPTYWYLAWLDTKGAVEIDARSERPEQTADFPAGNRLVSVDPHDPVGVHLILLLVSDLPPNQIESRLRQSLAAAGSPSTVLGKRPSRGVTRGAGSIHSTSVNLDPAYCQRVEGLLPAGVRCVHQLYLPTQT